MYRWHVEIEVMKRRKREDRWRNKPMGFWRKKHPLDCGRPRCGMCHNEKFYSKKPRNIKELIRQELTYY